MNSHELARQHTPISGVCLFGHFADIGWLLVVGKLVQESKEVEQSVAKIVRVRPGLFHDA